MKYNYLVYVRGSQTPAPSLALPAGYTTEWWCPAVDWVLPPTMAPRFGLWSLMQVAKVFARPLLALLLVRSGKGEIVHRSCVLPKYFRWPFMADDDVMISSTWTNPEERGKGLASAALAQIVGDLGTGRRFWYVTREENRASIVVCERVGFALAGMARRRARLGMRVLGWLDLDRPTAHAGKAGLAP